MLPRNGGCVTPQLIAETVSKGCLRDHIRDSARLTVFSHIKKRMCKMSLVNKTTTKYSRKLSTNDLISIARDRYFSFNNQFILEGHGVLDKARWLTAVETASAANPGSRLIMKGYPFASRWVDSGITPRVREVDGSEWTGYSHEGAPFLLDPLSPVEGPTCEVVLVRGNPLRVVFRSNHGVMDARGTLFWAEDVFRALRGEPVLGSKFALNDEEIAGNLPKIKKEKIPKNNITPGGKVQGDDQGFVWLRKTIHGRFRNLLSQVVCLSAREAWKDSDGSVVFCISVDLRRHLPPETRATGFLSNNFFMEIKPEYTVEKITELLKKNLNEKREITYSRLNRLLFCVPIGMINGFVRSISKKMHDSGRYLASGIVVTLGVIPLETYTGGGFYPSVTYAIPPFLDVFPFFIAMIGNGKDVEVMITMHKGLASNGRIEAIMESITSQLAPEKK
ncbi:MAG: hypothetical protein CVU55_05520 [Deltaproteobacteria bacterium HGW-Deltaproteobacteria-13]|jgi:hypothetical protein|nr:MAG: hypothetical protein CVU55_05520 [Deltaproteobacteria bacterium HGW-Deltaproteobacteria-13]